MEHIERKAQKSNATLAICITALFMALNIMMSSFGLPVPGGHLYLNDVIICTAAILLDDPKAAFIVGGVGAFLGDLFFYPTPMFVSLACFTRTHYIHEHLFFTHTDAACLLYLHVE